MKRKNDEDKNRDGIIIMLVLKSDDQEIVSDDPSLPDTIQIRKTQHIQFEEIS